MVVVAVAALCEVSNSFQSVAGPDEVLDPFGSFAVVDSCKPDDYSASDNSSYSVVVVADVDAESVAAVVVVAAAGEGVIVVVVAGLPSRNSTVETVSSTWEKRVVGAWALTSQPSSPCIVVVVVEVACCNCSDN